MKIVVNRQLTSGLYYVAFKLTDFTSDEVQKMQSFGVPNINVKIGVAPPGTRLPFNQIPLNSMGEQHKAGFRSLEEANEYEAGVIKNIRDALQRLRNSKDDFTGTQEVEI